AIGRKVAFSERVERTLRALVGRLRKRHSSRIAPLVNEGEGRMDPAMVPVSAQAGVVFQDGLGERRCTSDPTGSGTVDVLCLRDDLTSVPSFEFALRERVSRLANFRNASFARVRS